MVGLDIQNLTFAYLESRVILEDISLSVAPGEMVALVGPNGSGKTTLLKAILGVLRPQGGQIWLDEHPLAQLPRRRIAQQVAVVPQNPLLPESFTALEMVLLGRTPYLGLLQGEGPKDLAIAQQAMELTDTWQLRDRRVGELSGGERQRVVIARALAQEPRILLLDEPTAHLDINHQASILELVWSLCRQQRLAVLAALHDLNLASQFADRVAMLAAGRLVALDRPSEVFNAANLRLVFGAEVRILTHPDSGKPLIVLGNSHTPQLAPPPNDGPRGVGA